MGKLWEFFLHHPLFRGTVTYSILWPSANLMHQSREKDREKYDFVAAAKYGLVGVTFVLPVYYTWLKTINRLMPGHDLKACIKKVCVEQTVYWPIAITVFFAGMNFYQGQTFKHFKEELKEKYKQTHLTGLCFWPYMAPIINYSKLISDKNRIVLASSASFLWACFLSYIKERELQKDPKA